MVATARPAWARMHRLTPVGELDIETAPQLRDVFDAVARDSDVEKVVIDLSELPFMDSTGINLLMTGALVSGRVLR